MEQLLAVPAKRILNSTNLVSIWERAVDIHTGCDWSAAGLEMGPGDQIGKDRLAQLEERLRQFRSALTNNDMTVIEQLWTEGKKVRDALGS